MESLHIDQVLQQGPSPRPLPPENATADELWKLAQWDTTPLFMNKLPCETLDGTQDDDKATASIQALQALIYDHDDETDPLKSTEESVHSLKERANDLFKLKHYRQALGFYQQALDLIESSVKTQVNNSQLPSTSAFDEISKKLLSNRAACHLALGDHFPLFVVTHAQLPSI